MIVPTTTQNQGSLDEHAGKPFWLLHRERIYPAGAKFLMKRSALVGERINVIGNLIADDGSVLPEGVFVPYQSVTFEDPSKQQEDKVSDQELPSDQRFYLESADQDTPLMEMFKAFAPAGPEAIDLFWAYQRSIGEYDIDPLEGLMAQLGVAFGDDWTDNQVKEMYVQLIGTLAASAVTPVSAGQSEEGVQEEAEETSSSAPEEENVGEPPGVAVGVPSKVYATSTYTYTVPEPEQGKRGRGRPRKDIAITSTPAPKPLGDPHKVSEVWDWDAVELAAALMKVYCRRPRDMEGLMAKAMGIVKRGLQ